MIPDRTADVDRRTVLRASGAALAVSVTGLAGCAEPDDGAGTPGETPGDGLSPTPGEETPPPEEEETPTPEEETPTPGEETPTPQEDA